MIIYQGARYFQKFKAHGDFHLAFSYPNCFDKKEFCTRYQCISRPELKAVYTINNNANPLELPEMLELPIENEGISAFDEVMTYLVLMPYSRTILPAVLPCVGLLNKDRNAVRSWKHYLHKLEDNYDHLVNSDRKKLNSHCNTLWSIATEEYRRAPSWMEKENNFVPIKKT